MYSLNRPILRIGLAVIALALLALGGPAAAQMRPQPPIVIQNATIWTGTGERIEGGTILVAGDKIRAIGQDVQVPRFAKIIDGTGMTVIPGLVDAMGTVSLAPAARAARRGNSPAVVTSRTVDGIDPFEKYGIEEAIRNGVTCVYVPTHGSGGVHGVGAIVKLIPGATVEDRVVVEEAALCASLGAGRSMLPIQRLKELKGLRGLLKGAKKYQEAWEEYDEALEEYATKIEERRKENEKAEKEKEKAEKEDEAKEKKPGDDPEKKGPDKDRPEKDTPKDETPKKDPPKKEPPKDEPPKEDPPEDEPPKEEPPKKEPPAAFCPEDAEPPRHIEDEDEHIEDEDDETGDEDPDHGGTTLGSFPFAQEGGPPEKKADAGDAKKKKDDELAKPKEPKIDRSKALLVRALEGKIAVRIEAHRAEDLANALELAREYPIKLILEGATESYKVAEAIAEAKVPVVLAGTVRAAQFENGKYRNHSLATPAVLHEAGIPFAIASGSDGSGLSRFLWIAAGLAASHGLDSDEALAAVTRHAAEILGIDDRVGTLEAGKDADLVLLSGSPFSGDSVVEAVVVNGKIIYQKK